MIPDPVFILAPPRSFTSVAAAMLGRHPELFALPETNLPSFDTVGDLLTAADTGPEPMADGLVRAVAQLLEGIQTGDAAARARCWLDERARMPAGDLLRDLAARIAPRIMVEKSPSTVTGRRSLERLAAAFPSARYIHLLRHPYGHGESLLRYMALHRRGGQLPPDHWLLALVPGAGDPQDAWLSIHRTIIAFLDAVPVERQLQVRGGDLLDHSPIQLHRIARWLGIDDGKVAVDAMRHPEGWEFAHQGPPGARFGNDLLFLASPRLRTVRGRSQTLAGPLPWRTDGTGFRPEVVDIARRFGYV
jgi:hypothetical protein